MPFVDDPDDLNPDVMPEGILDWPDDDGCWPEYHPDWEAIQREIDSWERYR